jgi:hypothetical protein
MGGPALIEKLPLMTTSPSSHSAFEVIYVFKFFINIQKISQQASEHNKLTKVTSGYMEIDEF